MLAQVELRKNDQGILPGFEMMTTCKDKRTATGDICERLAHAIYHTGERHIKHSLFGMTVVPDITLMDKALEVKSNNRSERLYLRNEQVFRHTAFIDNRSDSSFVIVRWTKKKGFNKLTSIEDVERSVIENVRTIIVIPSFLFLPAILSEKDARIYRPAREEFHKWYSGTWIQSSNARLLEEDPMQWIRDWQVFNPNKFTVKSKKVDIKYKNYEGKCSLKEVRTKQHPSVYLHVRNYREELAMFYDWFVEANGWQTYMSEDLHEF